MEFAFTEEQQMIRETTANFLADVSSSEAIRSAMQTELGYAPDVWQQLCTELCLHAVTIPESMGGMGLGYVELVAVLEEMGRSLLCSPYFSTVCLATNTLLLAANEEQQSEYFAQILEGSTATLAYTSDNGSWDADAVQATVTKEANHYVLNGEYRYVIDGHSAELLIVAARAPTSSGEAGISLFVLPADTQGVSRNWLATMDQTRKQATVCLKNVTLAESALMAVEGEGWPILQKIIQLATVAVSAEQMGGADQILEMTVAYTKERRQFNRPIASFQAVKHRAADMMLKAEVARSAVYYAACVADEALRGESLGEELAEAASVAKAYCSDAFFENAGDALQLHGGVGFTWEYDVHLYFKRAKSSGVLLGDAAYHREKIADLLLLD